MKKEIKQGRKYMLINIDEHYAADVFEAFKKAALFDDWDKNIDLVGLTFKQFCIDTFGGLYMPSITIDGERSYWLETEGNNKVVRPLEQLEDILYCNYCESNEFKMIEELGVGLKYLREDMWKKLIHAKNCKEIALAKFSANYPTIFLVWDWVDVKDLDRKWDGF